MTSDIKKKRIHKSAEERQSEILTVASRIFSEHGYQLADVQAIADAAGVGKGTVYRYFPSKEALFKATIHRHLDVLNHHIEHALHSVSDPLDKIKSVMLAYLTFFEDNPYIIELFAQERAEFRAQAESTYFNRMKENRGEWLSLFHDLKNNYDCRDIDAEEMMDVCSNIMHGVVMVVESPVPRRSAKERVDTIFKVYTQGVLLHTPK